MTNDDFYNKPEVILQMEYNKLDHMIYDLAQIQRPQLNAHFMKLLDEIKEQKKKIMGLEQADEARP